MENLIELCESGIKREKSNTPKTFAEQFLEEPIPEYQIAGVGSVAVFAKSVPIPYPTFCYFRKIPVVDDADWLE